MTNKQFYYLCGVVFLCTAAITNDWYLFLLAFVNSIASICTDD